VTYWGAIAIAIGLWLATGWYLNERLKLVHAKLDRIFENFDGLRQYLYEIDPQFNEERQLLQGLFTDEPETTFDGMELMELEKKKKEDGYRTLSSHFLDGGFRAPNN
jgi:hypothetical protein